MIGRSGYREMKNNNNNNNRENKTSRIVKVSRKTRAVAKEQSLEAAGDGSRRPQLALPGEQGEQREQREHQFGSSSPAG